jgi:hypothetical protein
MMSVSFSSSEDFWVMRITLVFRGFPNARFLVLCDIEHVNQNGVKKELGSPPFWGEAITVSVVKNIPCFRD